MASASPDEWHLVMPTSLGAMERLKRSELEAHERKVLDEWESSHGHWSGVGKHTSDTDFADAKKIHTRFKESDVELGEGGFGKVVKVLYHHNNKAITLARKRIGHRTSKIQELRDEARVMEKLNHTHVVKLVGTYCIKRNQLYLLIWPVATCTLWDLIQDVEEMRLGQGDEDTVSRLAALDLTDLSFLNGPPRQDSREQHHRHHQHHDTGRTTCPLQFLQEIMGCLTAALKYCHSQNVRHLDIKPENVLVKAGQVYLADFGISKDVDAQEHTKTCGVRGTRRWRAPEIADLGNEWSMQNADMYGLGLILAYISSLVYGSGIAAFNLITADDYNHPQVLLTKLATCLDNLERSALATQKMADHKAHTVAPRHAIGLLRQMLLADAKRRPTAQEADAILAQLGGIEQVYHGSCCKKSSRAVTSMIDTRYKVLMDENQQLRDKLATAERRLTELSNLGETYEQRLHIERVQHARVMTASENKLKLDHKAALEALQDQLDAERAKNRRFQGQGQRPGAGNGGGGGGSGGGANRRNQRTGGQGGQGQPRANRNDAPASTGGDQDGLMMRVPTRPRSQYNTRPATTTTTPSPPRAATVNRPAPTTAAAALQPPRRVSTPSSLRNSQAATVSSTARSATRSSTPQTPVNDTTTTTTNTLRSRGSHTRIPMAVTPSTPIRTSRSGTPQLSREHTDSTTQSSAASSMFSRHSSNFSRDSGGSGGVPSPRIPDAKESPPTPSHVPPPSHPDALFPSATATTTAFVSSTDVVAALQQGEATEKPPSSSRRHPPPSPVMVGVGLGITRAAPAPESAKDTVVFVVEREVTTATRRPPEEQGQQQQQDTPLSPALSAAGTVATTTGSVFSAGMAESPTRPRAMRPRLSSQPLPPPASMPTAKSWADVAASKFVRGGNAALVQ